MTTFTIVGLALFGFAAAFIVAVIMVMSAIADGFRH